MKGISSFSWHMVLTTVMTPGTVVKPVLISLPSFLIQQMTYISISS
jgi:hypothetical protein